jgi:DNA primase
MYYTARPLHTQGARYLAGRGIDVDILERHNRRYETGHTPDISNGLVQWMSQRGFADDELVDAGLAHRQVGGHQLSDFYRHRVLIPVRDPNQKLAGFIGRNIGDSRWPKYKNPPRTLRYDKSINLYQPLPAPEQQQGTVIVVEGTLDAMAIAVAAIQIGKSDWYCPVTQSGRQLSPHQLRYVLNLHSQPPIVAMDGDQPGLDSNARLYDAAVAVGREARVVSLPWGEDPASLLRSRGAEGLAHFGRPAIQAWGESASLKAGLRMARSSTPGRDVMQADQSDAHHLATTNKSGPTI